MQSFDLPKHCWLLPIFFFGFLLSQLGVLGGFPAGPFSVWLILASLDSVLTLFPGERFQRGRLVIWAAAAMYFTGAAGVPLLGVFFVVLPAFLWVETKTSIPKWIPLGIGFLFLVQIPALVLMQKMNLLMMVRYAGLLYGFRVLAWYRYRSSNPALSFFQTMECFLSPVFFLFPLNANFLKVEQTLKKGDVEEVHFFWIFRGLFFAFLFWLLSRVGSEWLARNYLIRSWESILVLPVLIVFFYLYFAQVSYLVAGFMSVSGGAVSPDFSAFWRARTLSEFFSRFHFWIYDFFQKLILPIELPFSMVGKKPLFLFIFLFFLICPFLSIWIAMAFAVLFCVLFFCSEYLRAWPKVGVVFTYFSLLLLVWVAYPLFYLNWTFSHFLQFWRG